MLGHSGVTVLMCVGGGVWGVGGFPDPQRSHQQATLALLQSTYHGDAHPCLSNQGTGEGRGEAVGSLQAELICQLA